MGWNTDHGLDGCLQKKREKGKEMFFPVCRCRSFEQKRGEYVNEIPTTSDGRDQCRRPGPVIDFKDKPGR